jgi:D-Tyr-tRNAtyr deacylase
LFVDDEPSDSTSIIKKILSAKLFGDEGGDGWKKSVVDIDGEVLCGQSQMSLIIQKGVGLIGISLAVYFTSFFQGFQAR